VQVSEEVARAHKLYGVWGWLLLVVVGSVFGALLALSETANFAETVGYELGAFLSLDHPTVDFYRVFLFLALGYALTVGNL